MPYPDDMRSAYRKTDEIFCRDCGYYFEVEGIVDMGSWDPVNEDDMRCPKCGSENVE